MYIRLSQVYCIQPARRKNAFVYKGLIFVFVFVGTKMLKHVLEICEKDGNYDNVFL